MAFCSADSVSALVTDWPELAVVAVAVAVVVVVIVVFGLLGEASASLILICEELCRGFAVIVVVVGDSCGELLLLLPFAMLLSMLEMNLLSVSLAATEAGLTLEAVDLWAVCCLD